MTTLADMTEDERAECRGMWVSYQTPMGDHLAVYEGNTTLYEPGYGSFIIPTDCITPLRDKPRAWGADGQPPAGEWEHINEPRFQNHKRRFVSEWEQA